MAERSQQPLPRRGHETSVRVVNVAAKQLVRPIATQIEVPIGDSEAVNMSNGDEHEDNDGDGLGQEEAAEEDKEDEKEEEAEEEAREPVVMTTPKTVSFRHL